VARKRRKISPRRKKPSRKKPAWKLVTYKKLEAWRTQQGLSKKKTAEVLGVTNSTYHNWARGTAVATMNTQERIVRLIEGRPRESPSPSKPASNGVAKATARIVEAWLGSSSSKTQVKDLPDLVRSVKEALS
jgi:transcriptional regulator with XRE-family HTH domain